jgi:CubicO group peptidase (beta-lactamase class C family)
MQRATPEQVGFSAERLHRVDTLMARYVQQGKLAGAVTLVARRGRVVHFQKVGLQDVEAASAMELDTIFRIYSMTKPITSVALMMLYEHGLFELSDPVSRYIPEFKQLKVYLNERELADLDREVTILHLLTHTAGLRYGDFEEQQTPLDRLYAAANLFSPGNTNEEMVRRLCQLPLANQPGTLWHYSVATEVVGYLVEVLSDRPLADFFEEQIFKPLGMQDATFVLPLEKASRLATLYGLTDQEPLGFIGDDVGGDYFTTRLHYGGGGLLSTAADYARFAQMLLNGGALDGAHLLGRKTVELMLANHLGPDLLPVVLSDPVPGFGFGIGGSVVMDIASVGRPGSVGEYGWGGWASTQFWIDPREQLLGVLMTQYIPAGTYPLEGEFKTVVYQALVD